VIINYFHEGGYGMWVLLALAAGLIPTVLLYARGGESLRVVSAVMLGLVLLGGAFFTMQGRGMTEDAIENVDPASRELIRDEGYKEASRPILFALIIVVAGGIPFAIGESRRRKS
jgi:hypothetical protein